jgi:hypothetical protein
MVVEELISLKKCEKLTSSNVPRGELLERVQCKFVRSGVCTRILRAHQELAPPWFTQRVGKGYLEKYFHLCGG